MLCRFLNWKERERTMKVYAIVSYGKHKRVISSAAVIAEDKIEAIEKAKSRNVFSADTIGFNMEKTIIEDQYKSGLSLEFCAKEIVKNGYIRIGKSILTHCYDGTVSVTDWFGKTTWFPELNIKAVQKFIDIQPQ